jgi:putative ABC transport system permease protein
MKFYATVAWRNIVRNKRRSLITGLAMGISVSLCMAMIGINDGFYQAFYDVMVTHRLGHIQVRHPAFAKSQSLYDTLNNTDALMEHIHTLEHTSAVTGRVYGNGLVSGEGISNGAQIVGVYPELESTFSSITNQITHGTYLTERSASNNEVVVGADLAKGLGVSIGDEAFVFSQGSDGSMVYDLYTTIGIYQSGNMMTDRSMQIHITDAQELFLLDQQLHEIMILVDAEDAIVPTQQALQNAAVVQKTPDISIQTWWETSPQTLDLMRFRDIGTTIFLSVVFFIAGFGILNTMVMSVFERTTEIGLLKALGLRPYQIVWLVVLEVIILSFIAGIFGFLVSVGLDVYLMNFGIDISNGTSKSVAIMGAYLEPRVFAVIKDDLFFTPVTSLFWISVLASQLDPVTALRSE